jgi:Fe-S cluster assembly protein SufD
MANKKVITRKKRTESTQKQFSFTGEMFSKISGNGDVPDNIKNIRKKAWNDFQIISFPTTQEEAWRRTDLKGLPAADFLLPELQKFDEAEVPPVPEELLQPLVGNAHGGQIIFTPTGVEIDNNPQIDDTGVIFTDLITAQKRHPDILNKIMGKIVKSEEGKFAALASSLAQNGVLLYVPQGLDLELPLHSIIWGPGDKLAFFTHLMVYLEEGSSATYVHESASPTVPDNSTLHAGVVEIFVGPGSNFKFVEFQSWGEHVWNFSHERAKVESDARIDWIFGAVGSHLTKNFSDIDLIGRGSTARMSGFYFTDGEQHLDHDTQQNHLAPDTTSDLLFKGALREKSRSVWQGMIYVAPGAQKSDGYQANRNLILDSTSRADSIPGLEILADDVRCTHGATVGKIDPEQVFYLETRGIPRKEAEKLVVKGFFDPIMQRIPYEGVRSRLQKAISVKTDY